MQTLRTPDDQPSPEFPEFPYTPNYFDVSDDDGGTLRMAWVQAGPANADPVLMLHGEPSWPYLYRKMIPVLTAAGHRVICPDLVGFGRSGQARAARIEDHQLCAPRLSGFAGTAVFDVLDLHRVTLVRTGLGWAESGFAAGRRASRTLQQAGRRSFPGLPTRGYPDAGDLVAVRANDPGNT